MTAVEWAIQHPQAALDVAIVLSVWLMLALPGSWFLVEAVLTVREEWHSAGWERWPDQTFVVAVLEALFLATLWLIWLRVATVLLDGG